MRDRKTKIIFLAVFTVVILVYCAPAAMAQNDEYVLLAPLPNLDKLSNDNILGTYIPYMFNLAIGISAAAAVLMIVIGGFQYMTTDAIQGKQQGKERVMNSIKGLVLVISAWLILYTVNPKLLDINLNIESITASTPKVRLGGTLSAGTGEVQEGYKLTPEQVEQNAAMVKILKDKGIYVNNDGKPCANGETSGCTNIIGLPDSTLKGVVDLKNACGDDCYIQITGGAEGGHRSHGPNKTVVDLDSGDKDLETYIINNKVKTYDDSKNETPNPRPSSLGPIYTSKVGNRNATFLKESNPPHWHVVFE